MVRTLAFDSRDVGFDSHRGCHIENRTMLYRFTRL